MGRLPDGAWLLSGLTGGLTRLACDFGAGADLMGADLIDADLADVDLMGADLMGIRVVGLAVAWVFAAVVV